MKKYKLFVILGIISILFFAACSSSSDSESIPGLGVEGTLLDVFQPQELYQVVSNQTGNDIEKMGCDKCMYNDGKDSILLFAGLKNGKIWLEGYRSNQKDWLSKMYIQGGNNSIVADVKAYKYISWIDNEQFNQEARFRIYTEVRTYYLKEMKPMKYITSNNCFSVKIENTYTDLNDSEKGTLPFVVFSSGKKILPAQNSYADIIKQWTNDYVYVKKRDLLQYSTPSNEFYSKEGNLEYTYNAVGENNYDPELFEGVSRECGVGTDNNSIVKFNLLKFDFEKKQILWIITHEQMLKKIGIELNDKDHMMISLDSKLSDEIWIYKLKILYDDLTKSDATYDLKVNIKTGELI